MTLVCGVMLAYIVFQGDIDRRIGSDKWLHLFFYSIPGYWTAQCIEYVIRIIFGYS